MQVARVREVVHRLSAVAEGFLLRQLVVVVREFQVHAPTVDVDGPAVTNSVLDHRAALDVPAGPPGPPGRRPSRFSWFTGFP